MQPTAEGKPSPGQTSHAPTPSPPWLISFLSLTASGNSSASAYMALAIISLSLIPLTIAWTGGPESPFILNAGWRLGSIAVQTLTLLSVRKYRALLFNPDALRLVIKNIPSRSMCLITVNQFEYAFFAWSARYLDISVSAVLFETWPVFLILLTSRLMRNAEYYRRVTPVTYGLVGLSFIGYLFVTAGERGHIIPGADTGELSKLAIGLALITAAVTAGAFGGAKFRWISDAVKRFPKSIRDTNNTADIQIFSAIAASTTAAAISIPIGLTAGIGLGETMNVREVAGAVLGGATILGIGAILWKKANLATDNVAINAMCYSIPVLSLIWLMALWEINIVRLDYLLIGVSAIMVSNVLIHLEPLILRRLNPNSVC